MFNKKKLFFTILILLVLSTGIWSTEIKNGEINRNIKCSANPDISYSLYLPSDYSKVEKWPLIFAMEPAARTKIPLNLFRNIAEDLGYIVVCSDNVRNEPWMEFFRAVNAVWQDVNSKFSIDRKRIIATGFSGGSRGASLFFNITDIYPSGIIACGAALTKNPDYKSISKSFYYGIVGEEDFNFNEMIVLSDLLNKKKIDNCLDITKGRHRWPDKNVLYRAVKWIRLFEMKRKKIKFKKDFINSTYMELVNYAKTLIKEKKYFYGVKYLGYVEKFFKDFKAKITGTYTKKIGIKSKKYLNDKKKIYKLMEDELKFIEKFKKIFSLIEKSKQVPDYSYIKNSLQIPLLIADSGKKGSHKAAWAIRLLNILSVKGWKFGFKHYKSKDYKKSVIYFRIATESNTENKNLLLYLAKGYLLSGDKRGAMGALLKILDAGIDMSDFILKDKDFESLKNEKKFISILKKMKALKIKQ